MAFLTISRFYTIGAALNGLAGAWGTLICLICPYSATCPAAFFLLMGVNILAFVHALVMFGATHAFHYITAMNLADFCTKNMTSSTKRKGWVVVTFPLVSRCLLLLNFSVSAASLGVAFTCSGKKPESPESPQNGQVTPTTSPQAKLFCDKPSPARDFGPLVVCVLLLGLFGICVSANAHVPPFLHRPQPPKGAEDVRANKGCLHYLGRFAGFFHP
uniref:Uncharacterized protein n=1 Tax=Zooxanthella nutricula TaxID=1333877 RepID=A0A7S2JF71_9DINO